jgi:hypothetical protein
MSRLLRTSEVSFKIEDLITSANNFLILVSPYIKFPQRLKKLIEVRLSSGKIKLQITTRDESMKELVWLKRFDSVVVNIVPTLHSKYYMNEKEALITSMNLYEFSMINNYEIGVLIIKDSEPESYDSLGKDYILMTGQNDLIIELTHQTAIQKAKNMAMNNINLSQININNIDLIS